ncbi:MAG: hypothetical protein JNJ95_11130 [Dechloromonas sp.]|nr:hypothetical protein [Dechloromonas sp.]
MQHQKCVFRNFALPVPTFDHLKEFQREYEQQNKIKLTNSQTLAIILQQHKEQREASA